MKGNDVGRIQGHLAVTRSFGDFSLKKFIICEPEITEYCVKKEDMFLILATDGLWDVNEYFF
jgi:protein phosphatase 1L